MTMERKGFPGEWLPGVINELKQHLTELNYSERTLRRLDAT